MSISRDILRLYLVTDRSWLCGESLATQVERAIQGGVTLVQLREKDASYEERLALAKELLIVTRRHGVPLIINDDPMLAKESGADGVHLGQGDGAVADARKLLGAKSIIGVSAHHPKEAKAAYLAGADYLGCGAAFGSATKGDAGQISLATLEESARSVPIPVVAIGGIGAHNAKELFHRGLAGIAVISAILAQDDMLSAAKRMRALAEEIANEEEYH